jgi:hypothetical protein
MTRLTVSEVLAGANAAIVGPDLDVTGALASLLTGVTGALPADAAAVLVTTEGSLEVLAATSHRVADLEVYQAQVDQGPCLDAMHTGQEVHGVGADELVARWPVAGPVIVRSGYQSVQAIPLTWRGETYGGLNVFRADARGFEDQQVECRALGDAVTMLIVNARLDGELLVSGLRAALADRAVVEQAKGALGYVRSLDMPAAFDALVAISREDGVPLGVAARQVMERARTGALT